MKIFAVDMIYIQIWQTSQHPVYHLINVSFAKVIESKLDL